MISKVLIAIHYRQFQEEFPLCHRVHASVVSTRYYSVPGVCSDDVEASEEDIHSKKRMILFLFYGLIRTRSRNLLTHWAQVDPLAHYYKGHQPVGCKSLMGGMTSSLKICWMKQNEMQKKCLPTFNAILRGEPHCTGAFDNFNEEGKKKFVTHGKSAHMHIGTVFFLKKKPPAAASRRHQHDFSPGN